MLGCLLTLMIAVPSLQSELKILSTPDGSTHPPPCTLTCTGISRYNETGEYGWYQWKNHALKRVTIKECGFVTEPIVTVSMKAWFCPPIIIDSIHNESVYVQTGIEATTSHIESKQCDVYWTANGYICWAATIGDRRYFLIEQCCNNLIEWHFAF